MDTEAYRWNCVCCGKEFTGLPLAMAFEAPVDWDALDDDSRKASGANDDFCEVHYPNGATDRFIRCLLPLPVSSLPQEFCFGVWMSVSETSWDIYLAGFDDGHYAADGCFGYLMHEIPDYPGSFCLHADVRFQDGGLRPRVFLHEVDHPLVAAQQNGIEISQIERWASRSHQS